MKKAHHSFASNNKVLRRIKEKNPTIAPKIPLIRQAYISYHIYKGSPSVLLPIGLTEIENTALEAIYSGETKKYSVDWIGKYRSAPEHSYCPLCGAPNPSQLEHYLPKAHYPEFTVLSWNLVPTCAVCNPKRGHHANTPAETRPLVHPYYEGFLLTNPIFNAKIIRPLSAVSFIPVASPGPFSPEIVARVERQIGLCFDTVSFNRWLATKLWRQEHARLSGLEHAAAVKDVERSFKIHRATTGMNSWDTIFFRALLADEDAVSWLCQTPCHL